MSSPVPELSQTPEQTSQITVFKTEMGTCVISPVVPKKNNKSKISASTQISTEGLPSLPCASTQVSPAAFDELSPSHFLEIRNRKILKRRVVTKLPHVNAFKQRKLASLRAGITWRPRGPKPIDSRPKIPPSPPSTNDVEPIQIEDTVPPQSQLQPSENPSPQKDPVLSQPETLPETAETIPEPHHHHHPNHHNQTLCHNKNLKRCKSNLLK